MLGVQAGQAPSAVTEVPGLHVMNVDPAAAAALYREKVVGPHRGMLPDSAISQIEEQLSGACTVEIAAFNEFVALLTDPEITERFDHVLFDTAPIGHTLLLLDASRNYQRQLARQSGQAPPEEALELLSRLTDPDHTRVLLVTLPEATPVHEAAALQDDLTRAGIKPVAWVVHQSLNAAAPTDPLLAAKAGAERRYFAEVTDEHADRTAVLPWSAMAPVGTQQLAALADAG